VNVDAAAPLNATVVVPLKLLPLMVTIVPMVALVGVKDVMRGGLTTVKLLALVVVPAELVTLIRSSLHTVLLPEFESPERGKSLKPRR